MRHKFMTLLVASAVIAVLFVGSVAGGVASDAAIGEENVTTGDVDVDVDADPIDGDASDDEVIIPPPEPPEPPIVEPPEPPIDEPPEPPDPEPPIFCPHSGSDCPPKPPVISL